MVPFMIQYLKAVIADCVQVLLIGIVFKQSGRKAFTAYKLGNTISGTFYFLEFNGVFKNPS